MLKINWEMVRQEAFTRIRFLFTVETLIKLSGEDDNYTPVSGDAIAQKRREKMWVSSHYGR